MDQWEWKDKNRNVYQIAVYWRSEDVKKMTEGMSIPLSDGILFRE